MAYKPKNRISLEHSTRILTGGDEPVIAVDNYRETLLRAINWYNANREEKDFRAYAEYYVKTTPSLKDSLYAITKAPLMDVKPIGMIGRLLRRGQHVSLDDMMKTFQLLEQLKMRFKKPAPKPVTLARATPVLSIQDRINEAAKTHIGEIEGLIDEFCASGTTFSLKSYMQGNQVSSVVAKKIESHIKQQLSHIETVVGGEDPQLNEGYSNFTKRGLRKFAEFLRSLVAECAQQVVSAKVARKPRARKVKPPAVLARKVVYMKEFAELNLKSILPEKIVGSSECWLYNTVSRKLTVLYGADNGFLSVSGTSVTNYDVAKSSVKTIRKPEVFFKTLSSTGKRAMANAWKGLSSKGSKARSRINDETIILACN